MTQEELKILEKKICRENNIIKRGTYSMTAAPKPSEEVVDTSGTIPDVVMPTTAEGMIQSSIDAMVSQYSEDDKPAQTEQDQKIAEIMNKFASNIQDNVSSLFNQVT